MTPQNISYMTAVFQTICDNNCELREDMQTLQEETQTLAENMQALAMRAAGYDQTHQTFKQIYEDVIRSLSS